MQATVAGLAPAWSEGCPPVHGTECREFPGRAQTIAAIAGHKDRTGPAPARIAGPLAVAVPIYQDRNRHWLRSISAIK